MLPTAMEPAISTPAHDARRHQLAGIGFGVAAGALWGLVFVVPSMLPAFSPLILSAARYVLYGVVSLALCIPVRRALLAKTTRRDWLALLALALPGNLIYYLCVAGAVQRAGVAPASLIVGLLPVTVTLAGARDHGSIPLRQLALPLLLAIAGVACIYADAPDTHGDGSYTLGLLLAAGALASWTIYAVGNARYLRAHPRFTSQEWSLLTGVATGALALVFLAPPALVLAPPPADASWPKLIAITAVVALGSSTLGNSLWNAASRRLPLTLSGQMIIFETVFALLYGFAYEARWPHPLELLATLLLLAGVALSARRHA